METEWNESGWQAEYYSPYLCITNPNGESGVVILNQSGRNVTLNQFRNSVKTHGVTRASEVFWKLRANAAA